MNLHCGPCAIVLITSLNGDCCLLLQATRTLDGKMFRTISSHFPSSTYLLSQKSKKSRSIEVIRKRFFGHHSTVSPDDVHRHLTSGLFRYKSDWVGQLSRDYLSALISGERENTLREICIANVGSLSHAVSCRFVISFIHLGLRCRGIRLLDWFCRSRYTFNSVDYCDQCHFLSAYAKFLCTYVSYKVFHYELCGNFNTFRPSYWWMWIQWWITLMFVITRCCRITPQMQ